MWLAVVIRKKVHNAETGTIDCTLEIGNVFLCLLFGMLKMLADFCDKQFLTTLK